jgi:hypothetical protein
MKQNLNMLLQSSKSPEMEAILKNLGSVAYSGDSDMPYDLLILNGKEFNGSFEKLLAEVRDKEKSIGIINITPEQIAALSALTGVSPATENTDGAILGFIKNKAGDIRHQIEYMPSMHADSVKLLTSKGIDPAPLYTNAIVKGIRAHFQTLNGMVGGTPTVNALAPTYSKSPYHLTQIPAKDLSVNMNNMQNLSAITMTVNSDIYIYHQNTASNKGFYVVVITALNAVSNGNRLSYIDHSDPGCSGGPVTTYETDQRFDYKITVTPQDSSGNTITGITVNTSSPAAASAGQNPVIDSLPNMDIYMHVLNQGTWQDVIFNPQYSNSNDNSNVSNFDINNGDSGTAAAIEYAMPDSDYIGGTTSSDVKFETLNIFQFPEPSGSSFNVKFNFDFYMKCDQRHTESTPSGNGGPPIVNTSNTSSDGTSTVTSDLLDLVALTKCG